jgi:hypothetical protein
MRTTRCAMNAYNLLFKVPKLNGVLWRVGFRDAEHNWLDRSYYAYLTLKPIENLIRRRNGA